jgi:nicotinate-nucleotide adenylyltransferase
MFHPPKLSSPFLWSGLRVGLLGGSFNPAHEGHLHAATVAMKYLNLDAVWWLVSTGNPFKSHANLIPLSDRIQACEALVKNNPRMIISDLEQQMGTIRSFDTITQLKNRFSKTDFIWVSGTDIAFEFHKWHHADKILDLIPFAFVGRPTQHGLVRANLFRNHIKLRHNTLNQGLNLPLKPHDIYWLFGEPLRDISSSKLRLN